ncbi:winged helix-turn-helix domain-containing protein [Robertkochia sediminum]|uniref:winged helix-turn-helix domain-containing protein n=1 Tax=Robertkochia sediminum TaxID=2785326 RepID=UPI00193417F5|nr:LysR family transcriptional regulator [Robertkochia sediminum]MBL7471561.1 LysR family transcriptional regulator [Robertkochia sediminum]
MSFKVKSKIWIEVGGQEFLGEGKVRLLKAIEQTGSLSKGARSINMSYKKAWHLLDGVNRCAKKPVTTNSVGGKGGGGTALTPYGKSLIAAFDQMNLNCREFLDQQMKAIRNL